MSEEYNIREVLAILSPSSISFACIPGPSPVKLTAHDVAARLRNCSRPANLLARGKYANDEVGYRSYYFAFAVEVAGLPLALKLSKSYPKSLTALINCTMQEFVGSTACPWHKGQDPFTIVNDKIVPCSMCGGTNKISWSDRRRAHLCNVPYTTWRRLYRDLHIQMVEIISRHEQEIVDALYERKRISGPDYEPPPRAA